MSTGDGFGYRWGRNGEFCLCPATVQVNLSYAVLLEYNPHRLKGDKGDELPRNGLYVYAKFSSHIHISMRCYSEYE